MRYLLIMSVIIFYACDVPVARPEMEQVHGPFKSEEENYQISVINEEIKVASYVTMDIYVEDDNGDPYTSDKLEAELWMPIHQHGSSPVTIDNMGDGNYQISKMYYSMAGEWEVRFTVENELIVIEREL